MQELDKSRLQTFEVVAVCLHVVSVDVGDDGHDRQQIEEGGVGLVGLDDDVVAAAESRIGTDAVEPPTDDKGRVEPCLRQHAGDEAGRGGLAVRPGDCDPLLQAHQFGEHQCPWNHRDAHAPGLDDFGIAGLYGG